MIAINLIPLNQVDKDNVFKKIYNDAVEFLKKEPDYVLKFIPALMTRKDPTDPTSRDEYPTGVNFKATQRYVCDEGECEFTYYQNSKQGRHGIIYNPDRMDFSKVETIQTNKDIDKAFFMIMVSTHCQADKRFAKFQNHRRNPNAQYYVEDVLAEAKANLHYEQMITKVRNLFFDQERMISDEQLRKACIEYKIELLDRPIEELRTLLAGNVMKLNGDMRYNLPELEKFVNAYAPETNGAAPNGDFEVDRTKVEAALDSGTIFKGKDGDKNAWILRNADDSTVTICFITFGKGKHEEQLYAAISENEDLYKTIIASIE